MINAGTVAAFLTLDTSQFESGLKAAAEKAEDFRKTYDDGMNGLGGFGSRLFDGLMNPLEQARDTLDALVSRFGSGMEGMQSGAAQTCDWLRRCRDGLLDFFRAADGFYPAAAAWSFLTETEQGFGRALRNVTERTDDWGRSLSAQLGKCTALADEQAAQGARMVAQAARLAADTGSAWLRMESAAGSAVRSACAGMRGAWRAAAPSLYAAAHGCASDMLRAVDAVLGYHSGGSSALRVRGGTAIASLISGVNARKSGAAASMRGVLGGMLTAAKSVSFTSVGQHIVGDILSGLNARSGALLKRARAIASGVSEVIHSALQINSPSKVMIPVGEAITEGMEVGLTRGSRSLYDTASAISLDTAEIMSSLSTAVPPAPAVADSRTDPAELLEKLLDAVERLADSQPTMEIDGRPFGRLVRAALPR